jgi:hypothetical protein
VKGDILLEKGQLDDACKELSEAVNVLAGGNEASFPAGFWPVIDSYTRAHLQRGGEFDLKQATLAIEIYLARVPRENIELREPAERRRAEIEARLKR